MNRDINQTGPTCGIYGIVNGILNMNKVSIPNKDRVDQKIYELLENFRYEIKDKELTRCTFLGEFFQLDIFTKFINDVINELHKSIISGGVDTVDDNIEYKIEVTSVNDLTQQHLITQLENKEAFILFSILKQNPVLDFLDDLNSHLKSENTQKHVISHWICIHDYCNKLKKFIVTDSYKGKRIKFTYENLKKKNNRLKNKIFKWEKYSHKKKRRLKSFLKSKNTQPTPSEQIENLVTNQLINKEKYLKNPEFKSVIEHTDGQMIVIRKV